MVLVYLPQSAMRRSALPVPVAALDDGPGPVLVEFVSQAHAVVWELEL